MISPSRRFERQFRERGYRSVAGVDEVGRGAWAGPLVAAAVVFRTSTRIDGLRDSKLLSAHRREQLALAIMDRALAWNVAVIPSSRIDSDGLGAANRHALEEAIIGLSKPVDAVLVDGLLSLSLAIPQRTIVSGDRRESVIAAASILAKVYRDQVMRRYHERFPVYGFDRHVGYGTVRHRTALRRFGPSSIHRFSFAPVRAIAAT